MFVTNHVVSGAAIGLALPRQPLSAFTAGLASHFALDAIPHWGLELGPDREGHYLRVAKRDGLVGLTLVAAILLVAPRKTRLSVAMGIAGAVLADMDKPVMHFFHRVLYPRWFNRFHGGIQSENRVYLRNEIAAGLVAGLVTLGLLWRARRVRPN